MDKQRKTGDKYFIDEPLKIEGKIIFDGTYFLAERFYYKVAKVLNYLSYNKMERCEACNLYAKKMIKIKPNYSLNGEKRYSDWGKKQDEI